MCRADEGSVVFFIHEEYSPRRAKSPAPLVIIIPSPIDWGRSVAVRRGTLPTWSGQGLLSIFGQSSPTSFDSFQTAFDCFTDRGAVSGAPPLLQALWSTPPTARTPRARITVHSSSTGYVHVLHGQQTSPLPTTRPRGPSAQNPCAPGGITPLCSQHKDRRSLRYAKIGFQRPY